MEVTYALDNIKATARAVYETGKGFMVWAFHAQMGAGKTTFIHALCEVLGVSSAIGSPTYSIINEYKSEEVGTIYHMDWYRLKDEAEAMEAGVEDTLYSGNLCLVEWPDRALGLLPPDAFHISIEVIDNTTRKLSLGIEQEPLKKA
jgi:tRNA threonylcarbamoyladenosine biosynthesis protein TsaE